MTKYRTTHGGTLGSDDIGTEVRLAGWVARRRDHGGVIFIDLRDASGIVQVVLNPENNPAPGETLRGLRSEYCIMVTGVVREREPGKTNPDMATGDIEVGVTKLEVLSTADVMPFQIDERFDADEARRLRYRYLDLRRPRMAANLKARSTVIRAMRHVLDDLDFLEVETPTLVVSTPEGARDMLVPSRLRPGHFYALPQSPQLFKQLLMVAGVERYYQIARCYRDEDFRADRQVEFTQLDLEGSFWDQDDVLDTLEAIVARVVERGQRSRDRAPHSQDHLRRGDGPLRERQARHPLRDGDRRPRRVFADSEFRAFAGALGCRRCGAGDQRREIRACPVPVSTSWSPMLRISAPRASSGWWRRKTAACARPLPSSSVRRSSPGWARLWRGQPGDVLLIVADTVKVVSSGAGPAPATARPTRES